MLIEAVPNFSEGRRPEVIAAIVAAGPAVCAGLLRQHITADAGPASLARRNADHYGMRRHVLGRHCAAADQAPFTQRDAATDGCIGANAGSSFHEGVHVVCLGVGARKGATRCDHVCEYTAWPQESVVADVTARVDGNVILDLHVIADVYIAVDEAVLANIALAAKRSSLHYMAEMPDPGAGADLTHTFVNNSCWMYEVIAH